MEDMAPTEAVTSRGKGANFLSLPRELRDQLHELLPIETNGLAFNTATGYSPLSRARRAAQARQKVHLPKSGRNTFKVLTEDLFLFLSSHISSWGVHCLTVPRVEERMQPSQRNNFEFDIRNFLTKIESKNHLVYSRRCRLEQPWGGTLQSS